MTTKPSWAGDGPSYTDMINSWGYEIVLLGVTTGKLGDVMALLRDGKKYGYFLSGYGDRDTLTQTWGDWDELQRLSFQECRSIFWANRKEFLEELRTFKFETQWYNNPEEAKQWLERFEEAIHE